MVRQGRARQIAAIKLRDPLSLLGVVLGVAGAMVVLSAGGQNLLRFGLAMQWLGIVVYFVADHRLRRRRRS
jgi:hypothetical protein